MNILLFAHDDVACRRRSQVAVHTFAAASAFLLGVCRDVSKPSLLGSR